MWTEKRKFYIYIYIYDKKIYSFKMSFFHIRSLFPTINIFNEVYFNVSIITPLLYHNKTHFETLIRKTFRTNFFIIIEFLNL